MNFSGNLSVFVYNCCNRNIPASCSRNITIGWMSNGWHLFLLGLGTTAKPISSRKTILWGLVVESRPQNTSEYSRRFWIVVSPFGTVTKSLRPKWNYLRILSNVLFDTFWPNTSRTLEHKSFEVSIALNSTHDKNVSFSSEESMVLVGPPLFIGSIESVSLYFLIIVQTVVLETSSCFAIVVLHSSICCRFIINSLNKLQIVLLTAQPCYAPIASSFSSKSEEKYSF